MKCIESENIKAPIQIITCHVLAFVSVKKLSTTAEECKAQHLKAVQKVHTIYLIHGKPSGCIQNTMKTQVKLSLLAHLTALCSSLHTLISAGVSVTRHFPAGSVTVPAWVSVHQVVQATFSSIQVSGSTLHNYMDLNQRELVVRSK